MACETWRTQCLPGMASLAKATAAVEAAVPLPATTVVQVASVLRVTVAPASTAPLIRGAVLWPGEAGADPLKGGRAGATVSMGLFSAPADMVSMPVAGSTSLAVMLWCVSASGPTA